MDERIGQRLVLLRRLRLLQAQRRWRLLADEHGQLRQHHAQLDQQCADLRRARARCLRQASPAEPGYTFALRRAVALADEADALARRIEAASIQLAALAAPLAAARQTLCKARRLLEDQQAAGTRRRTGTP